MGLAATPRAALLETKLRALASASPTAEFAAFGDAVAIHDAGIGHALAVGEGPRVFGSVALWAHSRGVRRLTLYVDDPVEAAAAAARMSVLAIEGSVSLIGSDGGSATVDPPDSDLRGAGSRATGSHRVPPEIAGLEDRLAGLGVEVVLDDGEIVLEFLGLEVGRIDRAAGADPVIEPGVGAVDREANRVLHGSDAGWTGLARVVALVRAQRRPGNELHPLATIARERWLDHSIRADPAAVGASRAHRLDGWFRTPTRTLSVGAPWDPA